MCDYFASVCMRVRMCTLVYVRYVYVHVYVYVRVYVLYVCMYACM